MDSKVWSYLLTLIVGVGFGFFIGKNASSTPNDNHTPVKEKTAIPTPEITKTDTTAVALKEPEDTGETEKENTSTTQPENTTIATTTSTLPETGECFKKSEDLSLQLTLFAEDLEQQKLMYDRENPSRLQDCSGIFHRVVKFVKSRCDNYTYPDPAVTRDSRSLSKWFHERNNLVIIDDPQKRANLIKPGSVLFFGSSGKKYGANLTIDQLASYNPKGIEHIGVVTEVTKDASGNVTGYVMFHGRRPGVHAQRSHYHSIKPPRLGYPVLGNWNQEWLAIANIMTPKS